MRGIHELLLADMGELNNPHKLHLWHEDTGPDLFHLHLGNSIDYDPLLVSSLTRGPLPVPEWSFAISELDTTTSTPLHSR